MLCAVAEPDEDARVDLSGKAVGELLALADGDLVHQRAQRRIGDALGSTRLLVDSPVDEGDGQQVRQAVVGRLPGPRVPLGRVHPDLVKSQEVGVHLDGVNIVYVVDVDQRAQLKNEVDRPLGVVLRGPGLGVDVLDDELVAGHGKLQLEGTGDELPYPGSSLERLRRAGHPVVREHRREYPVADRAGGCAPLPHRQLADASLTDRDIGSHGEGQGVAEPVAVEAEQLAHEHRRRRHDVQPLVPSPLAQPHGRGERAVHLVADHDGLHQLGARRVSGLADGERAGDHVARMTSAAPLGEVHVVAVEVSDHHRVGECGEFRGGGRFQAEDGGPGPAGGLAGQRPRDPGGRAVHRRDRAAERVD